MVLTIDVQGQLLSMILNAAGLAVLGFIGWTLRQGWKALISAHEKLDHLDECMDAVKAASDADRAAAALHRAETESANKKIAELERDYAGLEGWVKGIVRLPTDAKLTDYFPAQEPPPPSSI